MKTLISTKGVDRAERSRHWHETIAEIYFPLDLRFRDPENFDGELHDWRLGDVSLSRLRSAPLLYRREPRHLVRDDNEHYLITIPLEAEVRFAQCGRDVRSRPGSFFIERSHEPYEFQHAEAADMWVLKVEARALARRIRTPERFLGLSFSTGNGAGGYFIDMLHHIPERFDAMTEDVREAVGRQLVDLLALSLQADERVLGSRDSSVRAAHLARIEAFVRANLRRRELDPDLIARHCGISIRYLHQLFRDTNRTLGQWVRDMRLETAREELSAAANARSIAAICYDLGFGDQAQFCRLFKLRYGCAPGEYRQKAQAGMKS